MEHELDGYGMPYGNKRAGFVGLMLAKQHLKRKPKDYNPPNEEGEFDTAKVTATKKKTPKFSSKEMKDPSKYILAHYPIRQPGRPRADDIPKRASAAERANMTADQLAQLREYERQRKREQRARKQGSGRAYEMLHEAYYGAE
jgi:hypothetical protein